MSWWTDPDTFAARLRQEQHRMKTEEPLKGTAAYLRDLENQEEAELLGRRPGRHSAPETVSRTPSH